MGRGISDLEEGYILLDPPQMIFLDISNLLSPSLMYKGGDQGVGQERLKTVTYLLGTPIKHFTDLY